MQVLFEPPPGVFRIAAFPPPDAVEVCEWLNVLASRLVFDHHVGTKGFRESVMQQLLADCKELKGDRVALLVWGVFSSCFDPQGAEHLWISLSRDTSRSSTLLWEKPFPGC